MFICDDQETVREGLRAPLAVVPPIDVVGVASNGAEAVQTIDCARVDVVLMDLKMPVMNGVRATLELRARCESIKILVLTTLADEEWVLDAIDAGADGYLLKDAPRERLVEAITDVAAGKNPVDAAVAGNLFHRSRPSHSNTTIVAADLTDRETEVLGLIGLGLSNADIAERLFLSEGTVRNYVSTILTKLAVEDRTQAAVMSIRAGFPPS